MGRGDSLASSLLLGSAPRREEKAARSTTHSTAIRQLKHKNSPRSALQVLTHNREKWRRGKAPEIDRVLDSLAVWESGQRLAGERYHITNGDDKTRQALHNTAKSRLREWVMSGSRLSEKALHQVFIEDALFEMPHRDLHPHHPWMERMREALEKGKGWEWFDRGFFPLVQTRTAPNRTQQQMISYIKQSLREGETHSYRHFQIKRSVRGSLITAGEKRPKRGSYIFQMMRSTGKYWPSVEETERIKQVHDLLVSKRVDEALSQSEPTSMRYLEEEGFRILAQECVRSMEDKIMEQWSEDPSRAIEGLYSAGYVDKDLNKLRAEILDLDELPRDVLRQSLEAFADPSKAVQDTHSTGMHAGQRRSSDTFICLMSRHLGWKKELHAFYPGAKPKPKGVKESQELAEIWRGQA